MTASKVDGSLALALVCVDNLKGEDKDTRSIVCSLVFMKRRIYISLLHRYALSPFQPLSRRFD